jgi:hypothetical protein
LSNVLVSHDSTQSKIETTYSRPERKAHQDSHQGPAPVTGDNTSHPNPNKQQEDDSAIQSSDGNADRKNRGRRNTKAVGLGPGEAGKDGTGGEAGQDEGLGHELEDGELGSIIIIIEGPQQELLDGEPRELVEDGREDDADLARRRRRGHVEKDRNKIGLGPQGRTQEKKNEDQPLAVAKQRAEAITLEVKNEGGRGRVQDDATARLLVVVRHISSRRRRLTKRKRRRGPASRPEPPWWMMAGRTTKDKRGDRYKRSEDQPSQWGKDIITKRRI